MICSYHSQDPFFIIWSDISVISKRNINAEYAECPICFGELHAEPLAVFTKGNNRVCSHFYHQRCAAAVMKAIRSRECPICRANFDGLLKIPDVTVDPVGWFWAVDLDSNGRLDKKEVVEVLKASLPIDWHILENRLDSLWMKWDKDGSGTIEVEEMVRPLDGLLAYVRKHIPSRRTNQSLHPPSLREDKMKWFHYWDEDNNGTLDMEEVLRALVKTICPKADIERICAIRGLLLALWDDFDPDRSGGVDAMEFCKLDGLADTVIANLP
eukprot:GHVS01010457.1.p1 GENE.GHVS01010457.1~~GHVS01010457.1.p1  ORF type:complete len:269 (+),score=27.86 GHVS01010457.1:429-1235(+)